MSNRPKNHQHTQSEPPRHPSGLIRALDSTGRTRGSAATPTPTIHSPTPEKGDFQAQIDRLNKMGSKEEHSTKLSTTADQSRPTALASSQKQAARDRNLSGSTASASSQKQIVHDRNLSGSTNSSQHSGTTSGAGASTSTTQAPLKPVSLSQLASEFEERLNNLIAKIQRTHLPANSQNALINEVRSIGTDFREHYKRLQQELDHITSEKDHFQSRLIETARTLQATAADRDKNRDECKALRRSVEELREKAKQSASDLEDANRRFKQETERLNKRLKVQDEQLKGKRALWLESNPGSSARRSAMTAIRDPFESPSASFTDSFESGNNMGNLKSPSIGSPFNTSFDSQPSWGGPPPPPKMNAPDSSHGPRRRPGLPTLRAKPAVDFMNASIQSPILRGFTTEPGDTPLNPSHGALVLFNKNEDEDPAPEFKQDITNIYVMIEGWVRMYANLPNLANDQQIPKTSQQLWEYMMNCTYPGSRQDAYAHTMALISDLGCRYWFVMRMIAYYLFKDIMSIEAWHNYNSDTDAELKDVAKKLQERGLPNEARQKLVDQRALTVQAIVTDPNYSHWRSGRLHYHSKRLRDMLGPILNAGVNRATAGKDLGLLAIKAWDESAKMFTAPLTFQVYFPETNSKFSAASMIAKDRPDVDPMQLQVRQSRLKLVITPVVTLRDDRGTTIKAKNLHYATILTMQ